jgi:hypothetical protein
MRAVVLRPEQHCCCRCCGICCCTDTDGHGWQAEVFYSQSVPNTHNWYNPAVPCAGTALGEVNDSTLQAHATVVHASESFEIAANRTSRGSHACCTHIQLLSHNAQTARRCCAHWVVLQVAPTMMLLRRTTRTCIKRHQMQPRASEVAPT